MKSRQVDLVYSLNEKNVFGCQSDCPLNIRVVLPNAEKKHCKSVKHNNLRQLKCMHANPKRNALHLQNKTACRVQKQEERAAGMWRTTSVLGDKSPAPPFTACPWSSLSEQTGPSSLSLRCILTDWHAKSCHCSPYKQAVLVIWEAFF